MNSVVESYLTFKTDNIIEYIRILAEEKKVLTKIPKQLNKLIYKYYDLFVLSNKEVDYEKIKVKTGISDTNEKLILFYLLIEYDMTSRTELSNSEYYSFYNFIVNSIIIFIELEKNISKKEHHSYEDSISKVLKKYEIYLDADYLLLIDNNYDILNKYYNQNQKIEEKFNETLECENYTLSLSKIKNSGNLYLSKFKYKNEKLDNESKKDVELINNEFAIKLNFINIEILQQRILKEVFTENKKYIFLYLEDDVITKKINLTKLEYLFKQRFLKERIYLLVNTSLLKEYEDRINYLINNEFNIAYFKNSELISKSIYKSKGYLFVDYNKLLDDEIKFAKDNNLELIVRLKTRLTDKEFEKLGNTKYISW